MPRVKKGQQKVPTLKKTTGLCPFRSYLYSMIAPVGPVHPEGGPEYVDGSAALVPGHRRLAL